MVSTRTKTEQRALIVQIKKANSVNNHPAFVPGPDQQLNSFSREAYAEFRKYLGNEAVPMLAQLPAAKQLRDVSLVG